MHIRHLLLPFLVVASATAASEGDLNAFAGMKFLSDDELDTGDQPAWGVYFDVRDQSWPVHAAVNYLGSRGSDGAATELIHELQAGVKYYLGEDAMRAWVGGGLAFAYASADVDTATGSSSDNDIAPGLWGAIGVTMTVNDNVNLGLSYGYSWAEVELFGTDVDAGGHALGFQVGYRW